VRATDKRSVSRADDVTSLLAMSARAREALRITKDMLCVRSAKSITTICFTENRDVCQDITSWQLKKRDAGK